MKHSEVYKNAKVYWFKRVTFRDNTDRVCLVKTRPGQTAPNLDDVVVPIVEGFLNGKAYFEMGEGDLINVLLYTDWEHLPMYNSRCVYQANISIPCSNFEFKKADRFGSCGFMVIGEQTGLPWKVVFEKLVNKKFFQNLTFDWKNPKSDYLPTSLWLTCDACRVLAVELGIAIFIFKDAATFEDYTLVHSSFGRLRPTKIVVMHIDGNHFSGLKPLNTDATSKLNEIFTSQLELLEEDSQTYQVILDFVANIMIFLC